MAPPCQATLVMATEPCRRSEGHRCLGGEQDALRHWLQRAAGAGPGQVAGRVLNHGLTAYDAAYLELAFRLGVALATQDHDLIKAAKALKVSRL